MTRRGAIIGFGKVAEHGHVPGWRSADGFAIVAVMDPSRDRQAAARAALPQVRTYDSLAQLFANEALDFVDVASPPAFHAEAVIAAAAAGAHVLCEKPVAITPAAYGEMRAAVERAAVVLHPVHNWRYSAAYRYARAQIDSGRLGRVQRVRLQVSRDGWAASDGDWRAQAAVAGGGILVDHGWHNFYLLLELIGERPQRIAARTDKRRYPAADVEDTASCRVEFEHAVGEIELTWAASERATVWTVTGERGELRLADDRVDEWVAGEHRQQRLDASLSQGSHHPEWFPGVIAEFAAEIARPPAARRGDGRRQAELCLALLDAAYTSARTGGVLRSVEGIE